MFSVAGQRASLHWSRAEPLRWQRRVSTMNRSNFVRRAALASALSMAVVPLAATSAFAAKPAGTAPSSPVISTVASSNRALTVSWTETDLGRISYKATATAAGHSTKSCKSKKLVCAIHSLANGVSYSVVVVASLNGASSAPSAAVSATVGVPSAPRSVKATAGVTQADISWSPPKASGVSAITSYTATASPGGATCTTTATATTKAARECVITALTTGTTYSVTVTATNAIGTSPASAPASVTSN
jgi:fibronectin type 3 domain-containing protein